MCPEPGVTSRGAGPDPRGCNFAAKARAITKYPRVVAWLSGPSGGGAQTHVKAQILATLSGTLPRPGSQTSGENFVVEKALSTSATGIPNSP